MRMPVAGASFAMIPMALAPVLSQWQVAATAVHEAYEKSTSCQQCHVGGIPTLFVPEVKPTTPRQLARRCYTNYKDLFNVTCGPCDGVAGKYWGDNDDKDFTADPCVVIGTPSQIPLNERVLAAFPPQFSVDILAGSDRWGRTTNPGASPPHQQPMRMCSRWPHALCSFCYPYMYVACASVHSTRLAASGP